MNSCVAVFGEILVHIKVALIHWIFMKIENI